MIIYINKKDREREQRLYSDSLHDTVARRIIVCVTLSRFCHGD